MTELVTKAYDFADGALAKEFGLPARTGGWGLLLCEDERGTRVTAAGDPAVSLALANALPGADRLNMGAEFPVLVPGWPGGWKTRSTRL